MRHLHIAKQHAASTMSTRQSKAHAGTAIGVILQVLRSAPLLPAAAAVFILGSVVCSLLPPLILEVIINELAAARGLRLSLAALYLLLLGSASLCCAVRDGLLTICGQRMIRGLRHELCEKLSRLPAGTLAAQEPGAVVSRFVGDAETVESLFTDGIASLFADACTMVGILAVILWKSKGLSLLLLFVLPMIYLFTRTVQKRTLRAQLDNRSAVARASSIVPETLRCIRTIHCLNKENYMQEHYDTAIQESFTAVNKVNFYDAVYSPIIQILQAVLVGLVMLLAASGNLRVQEFFGMSVGTAVAMISYIAKIFDPIESIGMELQTIQSAAAGMHRINEFLQQKERWETDPPVETCADYERSSAAAAHSAAAPAAAASCGSFAAAPGSSVAVAANPAAQIPAIALQGVTFGYEKGQPVLQNLSFTILSGEQVTLTGRTGSGKSTLFKLLLGLYRPQEGSVWIEGRDASRIADADKRHLFGYVEQSFRMVPGTVLEQITLFDPQITREAAAKAAALTGIAAAIDALPQGYDTPCTEDLFSQGQWQLLSIARAIAANPRILLLDEITASLDADTEQQVLSALRRACEHRTVVSISHRIYEKLGGRKIALTTDADF